VGGGGGGGGVEAEWNWRRRVSPRHSGSNVEGKNLETKKEEPSSRGRGGGGSMYLRKVLKRRTRKGRGVALLGKVER